MTADKAITLSADYQIREVVQQFLKFALRDQCLGGTLHQILYLSMNFKCSRLNMPRDIELRHVPVLPSAFFRM